MFVVQIDEKNEISIHPMRRKFLWHVYKSYLEHDQSEMNWSTENVRHMLLKACLEHQYHPDEFKIKHKELKKLGTHEFKCSVVNGFLLRASIKWIPQEE